MAKFEPSYKAGLLKKHIVQEYMWFGSIFVSRTSVKNEITEGYQLFKENSLDL